MSSLILMEVPGATSATYEAINTAIGIHSAADLPAGCRWHVAGETPAGMTIVDHWDSAEQFGEFGETKIGPTAASLGLAPDAVRPRVLQVHHHFAGMGTKAGVMMIAEMTGMGPADYDAMSAGMDQHMADGSSHPAVSHIAAFDDSGLVVVDVWRSAEEFNGFAKAVLAQQMQGLPPLQPRFVPVFNRLVSPTRARAEV